MPRYFFNTADSERDLDDEGTELPDHHVARAYAIKFAGLALSQDPGLLWDCQDFRVEVTDEKGLLLFSIVTHSVDAAAVQ